MKSTWLGAWAVGLVLVSGCPKEDEPTAMGGEPDAGSSCPAETPDFNIGPAGLTAVDSKLGIKVRLEDADFKPPRFGSNTWTIAITDMADQPLPNAQLTWACAFMPLHGHGSNPKSVEKLDATRWRLNRQNMAMQGGWEIRLWVDPDGGGQEFAPASSGITANACRAPDGSLENIKLLACVPRKLDEN